MRPVKQQPKVAKNFQPKFCEETVLRLCFSQRPSAITRHAVVNFHECEFQLHTFSLGVEWLLCVCVWLN